MSASSSSTFHFNRPEKGAAHGVELAVVRGHAPEPALGALQGAVGGDVALLGEVQLAARLPDHALAAGAAHARVGEAREQPDERVGCELCAWACPADAIYVEGADNTPDAQFSPGERYGRVYQINYLRCIFCGLCIEACPTRALTMTNFYELADDNRADLIFTKDQLLAPLQPGMLRPPFPMAEGMEERDYYQGKVTGATTPQRAYVKAREARVVVDESPRAHDEPGNVGASRPGEHDVVHTTAPTAAQTREGANP